MLVRGPRASLGSRPATPFIKITQIQHVLTILYDDLTYRQSHVVSGHAPEVPFKAI